MSKRKRTSLGRAMGQAIVGFDYQVFRSTPPPPELFEAAKPLPPVAAADGGLIDIGLPQDEPPASTDVEAIEDDIETDEDDEDDDGSDEDPTVSGSTPPR